MINRRTFIAGIGLGFLPCTNANVHIRNAQSDVLTKLSGKAFGTTWQLTIPSSRRLTEIINACTYSINTVNQALSPWDPHSDIAVFNHTKSTAWLPVSSCCSDVIASALTIASKSNGYFDPTVGPIVGRMGFGPIDRVDETVNYKRIDVRHNALKKTHPQMTLDPCGIAKGYALDLIVTKLNKMGVSDHLLEIGGEVYAAGRHPSGRRWRVAIESPTVSGIIPGQYINIQDKALASSGIKHNSYRIGKRLMSHIVDPMRRESIDDSLLSVSVIADTAMEADGWATALLAAGGVIGLAKAKELEIPALFVSRTDLHTVKTTRVSGFDASLISKV